MGITCSTHLRHSGFALQPRPFLRLQPFAILQIPQTTFALEFAISLNEIESEKRYTHCLRWRNIQYWPNYFEWLIRYFIINQIQYLKKILNFMISDDLASDNVVIHNHSH